MVADDRWCTTVESHAAVYLHAAVRYVRGDEGREQLKTNPLKVKFWKGQFPLSLIDCVSRFKCFNIRFKRAKELN